MKKNILYIFFGLSLLLTACYSMEDPDFKELTPISITAESDVINIPIGQRLVYDRLVVKSDLPVTYQWAYGPKKTTGVVNEYDMQTMTIISDEPEINHTFTKLGTYILRLRLDNGESVEYKFFTLNVNSGLDEGLCILANDESGKGSLVFIKKLTEEEEAEDAKELWPNVFATINPDFPLDNLTDAFMSVYKESASLLIATNDDRGTIYKLEPKTFELISTVRMKDEFGTYCAGFTGEESGSAAYYTLIRGADKGTYRYDLNGDFLAKREDASALGEVDYNSDLIYTSSSTSTSPNRKALLYNETTLFQPGNGKVSSQSLADYRIINVGTKRDKNYVYVLFQSMQDPTQYAIRRTSGTLGNFNSSDKKDFTTETLNMDQNSIVVNTWNSSDVYYTYNNKVWRWGLNIEPPTDPTLSIDEGEIICAMGTNFMGDYGDRGTTDETLLYVASYNEATKKGSLYIFDIKTQTLVEKYQDVCDRPVKLLYKYRIS